MKKIIFSFLIFVFFSFQGFSEIWMLSNTYLEVRFNDETALISVTDKRCNKTWRQITLNENLAAEQIAKIDNTLHVKFSGEFPLEVTFTLKESSALEVELVTDENMPFEKLAFPPAFKTPDENHYLLFTDGEGFLLKADDTEYGIGRQMMYSMRGLSMPWMGITDTDFKTGYMAIVDTPDDSEIWVKRYDGLISFEPLWISQKGKFGYNRKLTYHFFSEGGYVAQCKKYREYVADEHYHKWAINEIIRVPLYQLVYHDAIVTTWRWDDASHHMPEIWWKKDLFDILYGTAPVWCLDRPRWTKFRETFIESYNDIGPWLEQIGYDEMISHRFVSGDHKVQKTTFSSGKKVIVNFSDNDFQFQDKLVKARSFLTDLEKFEDLEK